MRHGITAAVLATAVLAGAGTAQAQQREFKVVDTTNLVVKPVATTTGIFAQSTQYVSQVVAGMIDNNGIIKTVNNLFGQRPKAAPIQGGLSPLPDPRSYPSGYYNSPIKPAMPIYPKR
jgi:hypothetical protein